MAYAEGELRGIGGWLAFFLVTLGVFTPLSSIVSVAMLSGEAEIAITYGTAWDTLIAWVWVMAGATAALAWFATWRMIARQNWLSVRITIAVLWAIAAITLIGEPLLVSLMTGLSFAELVGAEGIGLIRPLVYCTIWTLYLLQSVRVANTYRGDPEDDGLAEVFE